MPHPSCFPSGEICSLSSLSTSHIALFLCVTHTNQLLKPMTKNSYESLYLERGAQTFITKSNGIASVSQHHWHLFVFIIITPVFCPLSLITYGSSEEDDSNYGNTIVPLETPKVLIHTTVCSVSVAKHLRYFTCSSEYSRQPCSCFHHPPHPSPKLSAPSVHPTLPPCNYMNSYGKYFSPSYCLFQEQIQEENSICDS